MMSHLLQWSDLSSMQDKKKIKKNKIVIQINKGNCIYIASGLVWLYLQIINEHMSDYS